MEFKKSRDPWLFEIMLILICVAISILFICLSANRFVVLNLYFLPVILAGYFLGRTNAGVLALLCALTITVATTVAPASWSTGADSPLLTGLAILLWSAVLGLSAILVGTLCDERAATIRELQRAYVGVAEVLSKYLQANDPRAQTQPHEVARLSQRVAEHLRLPAKQIDHIRVAALLHDLTNVEITTQVISRAVGSLEGNPALASRKTFMGTDLVTSLSDVLQGALPLVVNQDDAVHDFLTQRDEADPSEVPLGAQIIRVVRSYDRLTFDRTYTPQEAIRQLRVDSGDAFQHVIDVLQRVVLSEESVKSNSEGLRPIEV